MKLKEKIKRFLTLDVHGHEGFTLVELIIVIAILAILSSVGVVGYSSYITKANKQADLTLIADVNHAIQLAFYSDPDFVPGVLILSKDAAPEGDESMLNVLQAAFGDGWSNIRLKYDWENTASSDFSDAYLSSSFNGNEESLLNEVGKLTNILSDTIAENPNLVGTGFEKFLKDSELEDTDSQTKANAAVMYAADLTVKADADKFNAAFDTFYADIAKGNTPNIGSLTLSLKQATNNSTFAACAALYAHAEAFCQYASAEDPSILTNFHENTNNMSCDDPDEALNTVGAAFQNVINTAYTLKSTASYVAGGYKNDVAAYLASMEAVSKNSDVFADRLGQADCYTDGTAAKLLVGYIAASKADIADGEVAIVVTVDANGNLIIVNVPTDY